MSYLSDRRLAKAVALLKVAAFTSGRDEVALHDCLLLEHVMWSRPEQAPVVRDWLLAHALPDACDADISVQLDAAYLEVRLDHLACLHTLPPQADLPPPSQLCRASCCEQAPSAGAAVWQQLAAARETLQGVALAATLQAARAVPALEASPWLAPDEARAAADSLKHAAAAHRSDACALLREVVAMECALRAHAPPHAVALLLPSRWLALAKAAREQALAAEDRLRTAIPPCGHRIARSYCAACLDGMGLIQASSRGRTRAA